MCINQFAFKLEQLVSDHPDQLKGLKSVDQGLELAKSNIQWVADFSSEILDWLKTENEASTVTPSGHRLFLLRLVLKELVHLPLKPLTWQSSFFWHSCPPLFIITQWRSGVSTVSS